VYATRQKEQFSLAFIQAVAAAAGCNVTRADVDDAVRPSCLIALAISPRGSARRAVRRRSWTAAAVVSCRRATAPRSLCRPSL